MEIFIPLVFISILIFVQIKKYKNMCKYLSNTYPQEWEKLSRNALGTSSLSVTNANLSESLKTGFFSTIADEKVKRFEKFRLINMYVVGVIGFISLVLTYSQ